MQKLKLMQNNLKRPLNCTRLCKINFEPQIFYTLEFVNLKALKLKKLHFTPLGWKNWVNILDVKIGQFGDVKNLKIAFTPTDWPIRWYENLEIFCLLQQYVNVKLLIIKLAKPDNNFHPNCVCNLFFCTWAWNSLFLEDISSFSSKLSSGQHLDYSDIFPRTPTTYVMSGLVKHESSFSSELDGHWLCH